MPTDPPTATRDPAPWLPLLRRLTELSPTWCAWKNVDRALAGYGDIDSACPAEDTAGLLREFRGWAVKNGMGPVFRCAHLPGSVLGVAVRRREELIELQLCQQAYFRGAVLFTARDLVPLMEMDDRGFRRLRPGAEGLLLLFYNSIRRGGRPRFLDEKARHPLTLIRRDPEGMALAASLFGGVREHALRVGRAAARGGWDYRSALRIELWAVVRAVRHPHLLAPRVRLRARSLGVCPLLPVLNRGRRLDGDVEQWIEAVARSHPVLAEEPGAGS